MMEPINFWRNSDPFEKKENFSYFLTGRNFLQKLIGTIISAVFPKMSYDLTFLVKIDILTDRTFCSPTVQWYILSHNDDDNMKSTSWKILVCTTDSNHDDAIRMHSEVLPRSTNCMFAF